MQAKRTTVYQHAELTTPAASGERGGDRRLEPGPVRSASACCTTCRHYGGRYYPVNARYERIGEHRCYPYVAALPEVPDCAVITAAREAVEEIVLDCVKAGVGGVIIFASGYAETGKQDRIAQQDRLAAIARETGLRIVGPNCIGVVNATARFAHHVHGHHADPATEPAAVGIISQSGALGMALAQAVVRGVSFSHVLTSGNSCDVDMADYVSYLADDPACAAIACVFEGMASPERLLLAADYAWQRDKPLIVFKMATGEQGAAAAMSHTGSLAGSHATYRAVFQRAGAVLVDDYRIADGDRGVLRQGTAAEGARASRWSRPRAARRSWRPIARSNTACRCRNRRMRVRDMLMAHIPEFGSARNPCDVTAQILANPESLDVCADALLGDPQLRRAGGADDLWLRAVGETDSGLRPTGEEARQDRLHRLADRMAGRSRREGGGRVRSTSRCSARCRTASPRWRHGTGAPANAAGGQASDRGDAGGNGAAARRADRGRGRPHADRTRGEGRCWRCTACRWSASALHRAWTKRWMPPARSAIRWC